MLRFAAGICLLLLATASSAAAQAAASRSCRVEVVLSPPWTNEADNSTLVSVNLNVFNTAPVAIAVPWTLTITNSNYGAAQQVFNLQFLNSSSGTFNGQATNFFQTLTPNGGAAAVGVIIAVSNGTGFPTKAALNGVDCTVTAAPPSPPPPPSGGAIESGGQLTTSNGQIIGVDGNPLYLIGLNYFGFDDGNTMIDGLWIGSESITQDFATIVYRQQLLGFNAVRLPFSFSIFDAPPKTQTYQCTQDAQSVITAATTAPGANPSTAPPAQVFTPPQVPGVCNSYLPEDTSLNRFLYVVNFFAQNNFYIILDNQFNLDQTAINNQQQWLQRWTDLVTQLTQKYPNAAARSLMDLLNEPDAFKLQWQPQSGLPGVGDLYLAAMDAIYAVNPGVLLLIEGAGQSGLAMNWGDGLAADSGLIQSKGISDTNPFFKTLLTKPYLNQVVAAPHVYPPSISKATIATQGADFWLRLSQSFGYLNKQGYCSGSNTVGSGSGNCHVFAVLIGETGTAFTDSRDDQPMKDFALWCNNQGAAADGLHSAVSGIFWWAWNANSGDTGGLVGEDWQTILWNKVAWLQSVGLKPWYAPGAGVTQQSSTPAAAPPATPPTVSSPPPVVTPPPTVSSPPPPTVSSPPPAVSNPPTPPLTGPPPPVVFSQTPPAPPPPNPNGVLGDAYRYPTPPPPGQTPLQNGGSGNSGGNSGGTGAIESAGSSLQPLTTSNGAIKGVDGLSIDFIGAAWYGFDNGTFLNGLVGDESISLDFATQVQRIIALGFNTVELPFSFKTLLQGSPSEIQTECTVTTYAELVMETNPPSITLPYGTMFPNLTASPTVTNDSCNSYIPSDSVLARFAYIVNFLTANGLYVRLDNRLDKDPSAVQNPQTWITSWTTLVTTLSQNEGTAARLLISPLTNPDIGGLRWSPSDGKPGVTNLFIQLMDALYPINPAMLYLIQGPSQQNLTGLGGSSYITTIPNAFIPDNKESDPNAFFKQLLVKPYVSQVVISPRVLAPSLAGTSNSSTGTALFNRLTTTFGYLNQQGYCVNQQCRVFPIAVSGFGSNFGTSQDSGFESDFVAWVKNSNIANDGLHNPIRSFFWNGWDPSSYAPILASNGVDLDYTKLDLLSSINLSPWYFAPTASRTPPVIPATYQNASQSASNQTFCGATVSVSLSGSRNGSSGGYLGSVAVTLVNLGAIAITPPWSLTLVSENYLGVSQAFGLVSTQASSEGVSGIAADTWNILWPDSTNQVTVGLVVAGSTNSSFTPQSVQINSNNCQLQQGSSASSASAPSALTGGSLGGAESADTGVTSLQAATATGVLSPVTAAGGGGT